MASVLEVLDRVLATGTMDADALDAVRHQREWVHLDFKSGKLLDGTHRDAARSVADDVSAFANSDGGLLVIGVADASRDIDGCPTHVGKRSLREWAVDAVSPISGFLVPPPAFIEITTQGQLVWWLPSRERQS